MSRTFARSRGQANRRSASPIGSHSAARVLGAQAERRVGHERGEHHRQLHRTVLMQVERLHVTL